MQQHITIEQLNELSPKAKKKLQQWWKPQWEDVMYNPNNPEMGEHQLISQWTVDLTHKAKEECYPLLSIGQCLEFLNDYINELTINVSEQRFYFVFSYKDKFNNLSIDKKRADGKLGQFIILLWEAVKEVLESES